VLIQSGVVTISGTEAEIELSEPVTVGESFAMVSSWAASQRLGAAHVTAELIDEVDGEWTKLKLERTYDTNSIHVSWQVFEDSNLTVQTGETSFTSGTSASASISEVDLAKSFCVLTMTGEGTSAHISRRPRGYFSDNTTLVIEQNTASYSTLYPIVRWYVVEWNDTSVQSGQTELTDVSDTVAINSIDLTETFLLANWSGDSHDSDTSMVLSRLSSAEEISFERESDDGSCLISYFAISKSDFSVQSGVGSMTGEDTITSTIDAVDLDVSFWSAHFLGNGKHDTDNGLYRSQNRHRLVDSETIEVQRYFDTETLTASWFVIEVEDVEEPDVPLPTVVTHEVSDIRKMGG